MQIIFLFKKILYTTTSLRRSCSTKKKRKKNYIYSDAFFLRESLWLGSPSAGAASYELAGQFFASLVLEAPCVQRIVNKEKEKEKGKRLIKISRTAMRQPQVSYTSVFVFFIFHVFSQCSPGLQLIRLYILEHSHSPKWKVLPVQEN